MVLSVEGGEEEIGDALGIVEGAEGLGGECSDIGVCGGIWGVGAHREWIGGGSQRRAGIGFIFDFL